MKKILLTFLLSLSSIFAFIFALTGHSFAVGEDIKSMLWEVAENQAGDIWVSNESWGGVRDFIINIWKKIVMPIVIVIWLLIAFIGFYKLFFSDKEDERKKWLNFFIWWTIWVILMVSAWFLTFTLVGHQWTVWIIGSNTNFDPATIAGRLYDNILRKFFTLAMYIVIVILFIILIVNLIKFISNPDKDDVQKHAKTIIIWNIIWIIVIIFSKNIVNMFYKKFNAGAHDLWQWWPILESKNIWWLYTVLNYVLGFIAFIITVFIIYQAFLLVTKPDDDNTYKNLKKYFVYAILWVLLIGWVYIIANFFIIK